MNCKIIQKNGWFALLILLLNHGALAQTTDKLSLAECYEMAKRNYPAIKKLDLIARTRDFDIENASKRFLPQVSFSGQATYQSQTINFADVLGSIPSGINFPSVSKDQYKVVGELSQLLYDAGNTRHQKEITTANAALQEQNIETGLYTLRQRINNLFFSVLLMDAQLKQNELNQANLQTQVQKAEAALANGVAFRSDVDELRAEVLNIQMMNAEYRANRTAFLNMLSLFIGKDLNSIANLALPENKDGETTIRRPELKAFTLQQSIYDVQEKQLESDYLPQVTAFFQGAYGRPTLNFIKNNFGPWYITGVRFSWSLGSLYSLQNKKNILAINRQAVDADMETFLFNTKIDLSQQDEQVIKYQALLLLDEKAIDLRQSVTKSSEAQLKNGVITTHEYIQKLNAEHLAWQSLILHEIQLLQTKYNQKFITGN